MPKIDVLVRSKENSCFNQRLNIPVKVNAEGMFYAHVPAFLEHSVKGSGLTLTPTMKKAKAETPWDATAMTFNELKGGFIRATELHLTPNIKEEYVICYNIDLRCNFAIDPANNTLRNAGEHPKGDWLSNSRDRSFGGLNGTWTDKGGYSIKIGARAMTKKTYTFGEHEEIRYDLYYGGGDHHESKSPSQKLNAWVGFHIDTDDCKEIPYTDEAALFFDTMIHGVVEMSRKINHFVGTPDKLMETIKNGASDLLI